MKTVLVVDDEQEIREVLKGLLEKYGYNVLVCESGEHAVLLLYRADVLITDWQMKGMTGIELVERAKNQKPDMPVLLMTGMVEKVPLIHHSDKVIAKPFTFSEIISWLQEVTKEKVTE